VPAAGLGADDARYSAGRTRPGPCGDAVRRESTCGPGTRAAACPRTASVGIRPRRPDRRLDHPRAVPGEDLVECRGELAVPVADQESKSPGPLAEVHQQVAGALGCPGCGRV